MQMHQAEVRPQYTALLDLDRKYIDVSDTFCRLLGRSRNDLIGRKTDDVTAPNSVDIHAVYDTFLSVGHSHGLWLLVHRTGTHILVRYDAVLTENKITAKMELVGAVRVLIVDDFEAWREFAASALQSDPQYLVVGFASDGLTAIKECERLKPDLVVLDIGLPGCDGIAAAKEIRRILPECDIVFLSQHTSADYMQAAFEVGARGFVAKGHGGELLRTVKTIRKANRFMNEGLKGI